MTDDQWIDLAEKARDGFHGRPIPHSLRVSDPVYMEAWVRCAKAIVASVKQEDKSIPICKEYSVQSGQEVAHG